MTLLERIDRIQGDVIAENPGTGSLIGAAAEDLSAPEGEFIMAVGAQVEALGVHPEDPDFGAFFAAVSGALQIGYRLALEDEQGLA